MVVVILREVVEGHPGRGRLSILWVLPDVFHDRDLATAMTRRFAPQ
jgi:hypothetical protein